MNLYSNCSEPLVTKLATSHKKVVPRGVTVYFHIVIEKNQYKSHFFNSYGSTTVEIHRTRGAPLKDYNVDLQKKSFFSSSYASVTLRGILQKNIDEASKKNNFQKKFIKKYLFV